MSSSSSSSSETVAVEPGKRPLTPVQKEALQQLKDKVKVEYLDASLAKGEMTATESFLMGQDSIYLRFLRARRYDVEKAFEMLMATAKWRRDFQNGRGVENIDEESIENELLTGKSFFYKYDKYDRPVVYIRPRFHKSGSIMQEEMERFIVWHMEIGREIMKPGTETCVVIYDMAGFGLSNMDYNLVKTQIGILQNYYPESLGITLLLNAPWIFKGCWSLIKNWIDPYAAKKIIFVTQPDLLNFINEEDLLVEYGGKDPFTYEYIPISKREELGRTEFKPTWLMDWAQEWKEKPAESTSSSEVNAETITNDLQDQTISDGPREPEKMDEAEEPTSEAAENTCYSSEEPL